MAKQAACRHQVWLARGGTTGSLSPLVLPNHPPTHSNHPPTLSAHLELKPPLRAAALAVRDVGGRRHTLGAGPERGGAWLEAVAQALRRLPGNLRSARSAQAHAGRSSAQCLPGSRQDV